MLIFTKTDKNTVITGKTFYAKEAIKAAGGKWDPTTNRWIISGDVNLWVLKGIEEAAKDSLKKEKDDAAQAAAFARSPAGIAAAVAEERKHILACLAQKKKDGSYNWICCEKCEVIDWKRQHTSCQACVEWGGQGWNTFRVRGSIYTGD